VAFPSKLKIWPCGKEEGGDRDETAPVHSMTARQHKRECGLSARGGLAKRNPTKEVEHMTRRWFPQSQGEEKGQWEKRGAPVTKSVWALKRLDERVCRSQGEKEKRVLQAWGTEGGKTDALR